MALVVLISSTGFGVVEHHCIVRGKVIHLAAFEQKDCHGCEHHASLPPLSDKTTVQKKSCCDDQQRYEHIETASSFSQSALKIIKIDADVVVENKALFPFQILSATVSPTGKSDVFTFSSFFHGRSLLSWVQVWVI